jgi:hypothetical protein
VSKRRIYISLGSVVLLSVFFMASAQAQGYGDGWSEPIRLSSDAGKASEGYCAADQYGYVHCFWTETLYSDRRTVIKYARFDGAAWSNPTDIYMTGSGIASFSPVVDQNGTIHIAWAEGFFGPVYYTHAPASNALSAQNWAEPIKVDIPAKILSLRIDHRGVFHLVYTNQIEAPGVYYIRSENGWNSWSKPVWLDPDILPDHIPASLNFELDEAGGLHAVWFYGADSTASSPDWVRYTHSLDGGQTWSAPYLIDKYDEEIDHNLTAAGPKMIVQGQTVHVIWADGDLPYRYHRFSTDAGQTWSVPRRIFGELHGQAFDGLSVDGAGRVHFIGQIRYPMGIYHAYLDQTNWTPPSMVYLISQGDEEAVIGDRVHAHHTHPTIRAGNQLVITFADGPADPNRRLFAMHRTLDDIAPLELVATPVPLETPVPVLTPTPGQPEPSPTLAATAPPVELADKSIEEVPRPDLAIQLALIPTVILLGGIFAVRLFFRSRH